MTSALSQIGFLLFVSALVAMLMRRLRLPYTVGLVLAGIGLYLTHVRLDLHLSKDLNFSPARSSSLATRRMASADYLDTTGLMFGQTSVYFQSSRLSLVRAHPRSRA